VAPTTSSRREASKPIRRVSIELTLDGEKPLLDFVSKQSGAKIKGGQLSLTITASDPQEALEKVRAVAACIKNAQASKDFK
jgi:hypothetical protein